jgi:2-dehydro-3-deoxygluconokinase
MSPALAIPPSGGLDVLSLGSIVMRLDPGIAPFRKARAVDIHVSGGEYNVAANLADCFGLRTGIATAMVDYPIGELVDERIRAMNVVPYYRRFAHDGVRGPNIATVYSDRGFGVRAPVVFYNRADEAAAKLAPGDFDWAAIFRDGVRWFHSGGIFAALSRTTADLIVEGMQAAHAAGAVVSFDLNYRAGIWASEGGEARARDVLTRITEQVDVLIAGEEDLRLRLGIGGPGTAPASGLDPSAFLAKMGQVVERFPRVRVVATTLREVHSTNRHSWSAVAWIDGTTHRAPTLELDVLDRVGSGDGFAAGLIYGLLTGADLDEALRLGWAHGALVTTFPGDTTMATLEQVRALASGGTARIQR